MSLSNSEISFLVDTMIVETILCDPPQGSGLYKRASAVGDLLGGVKGYVDKHINPNDKVASVINMLAPAVITGALGAMGFGWWRFLVGLAISVFHINVGGIFEHMYEAVKNMITGGKQVTAQEVDAAAQQAVQNNTGTVSSHEEAAKAQEDAKNFKAASTNYKLRQARMLKLAMIEYEYQTFALTKEAFSLNPLEWFRKSQGTTTSLLSTIVGWIFKVVLGSAGFMIGADFLNHLVGRPSALDPGYQEGQPGTATGPSESAAPAAPTVSQTKFPLNPSYREGAHPQPWVESIPNNEGSISNLLMGWAKEVYNGLNGREALITSSPAFQAVVDKIAWSNHAHGGDNMVFIPKMFSNKKSIVDYFIDDVAQKAQ